ncbi:hypothetical protein H0A36_29145 [Endozoicomonas sp. SM1973]|uniref:TMhelix containing protein n=1 Tax=Spartinivicinus marinus TaxID=2994442 RepID=A0A853IM35_9GAMM|nr:hypothetical protein [Spartinivicinus marinus]NYZ70085.1 hypothetical protein [Spartinivicinus marinus]
MYSTIINTVTGLFQSYLTNKQHKAELKQAVHQKQLDEIQQGNISASELDSISIQSRGWKDDFLLIITVLPLVICFVPGMSIYIQDGFDALKASVPEWYLYALALVFIDTFGFRRILRSVLVQYLTNKFGK